MTKIKQEDITKYTKSQEELLQEKRTIISDKDFSFDDISEIYMDIELDGNTYFLRDIHLDFINKNGG